MFNFFKKKRKYDLQWLGTDMHTHILPGIDDGCNDVATSRQCLEGLCELGLHTFICTPHRYPSKYPNTKASIHEAMDTLAQYLIQHPLPSSCTLTASAEYMLEEGDISSVIQVEECMPLSDNLLLVELPWMAEPYYVEDCIFKFMTAGKQPVLAHPERYTYYFHKKEQLQRFQDMGCLLQVNLLSLSGYYGPEPKHMANWLVKQQIVDFVGTDLHHLRHLQALTHYCTTTDTKQLLCDNPIKNGQLNMNYSIHNIPHHV